MVKASGNAPQRLIIGISGASGVIYGVRALELLRKMDKSIKPEKVRLLPHRIAQQPDILERMKAEGKTFGSVGGLAGPSAGREMAVRETSQAVGRRP